MLVLDNFLILQLWHNAKRKENTMEITRNLLLHQWYKFYSVKTTEDTRKFISLIDTYGEEKVFDAMAFSHFSNLCGAFVSIREHTERDFIDAPKKFEGRYSQKEFEARKQEFYEGILNSYNSRPYKDGQYSIIALPDYSVAWIEERTASKGNYEYEIQANTFSGIPFGLPIRQKAVDFAFQQNSSDFVYAVVYQEPKKGIITCLFLLKYEKNIKSHRICRCIGKRKVKHHWLPVRIYVEEHAEEIKQQKKVEFSIDW